MVVFNLLLRYFIWRIISASFYQVWLWPNTIHTST
ncbi:hypothetical protein BT93_F1366 [Corymbia citriodora subsp. variegata]|nr:hypothetical protein BT93_F1366 [Corymbia citriodora subsp. variegata]